MKYTLIIVSIVVIGIFAWNPDIPRDKALSYVPEVGEKYNHLIPQDLDLMDFTFGVCVYALIKTADAFGITYNQANIWVFVIIGPIIFVSLLGYIWYLRSRLNSLQKKLSIDG